ncbi:hypothetical protein BCR34DRAFT_160109 [Clohesyomyces aquaticus]|uniref:Uncharacterized protein n=1 Tax=Clohesyomyces aquaticus TaxID=1231657 RepID=A0A1Y1YIP0_9PLEO|nr:hypothetical protein BCR34DRAFT_160109 [Clohesyomyces aquaticus]
MALIGGERTFATQTELLVVRGRHEAIDDAVHTGAERVCAGERSRAAREGIEGGRRCALTLVAFIPRGYGNAPVGAGNIFWLASKPDFHRFIVRDLTAPTSHASLTKKRRLDAPTIVHPTTRHHAGGHVVCSGRPKGRPGMHKIGVPTSTRRSQSSQPLRLSRTPPPPHRGVRVPKSGAVPPSFPYVTHPNNLPRQFCSKNNLKAR